MSTGIVYYILFTDVVSAYKGLQKEKEALENSVTILSAAQTESPKTELKLKAKEGEVKDDVGEGQERAVEGGSDPLGVMVSGLLHTKYCIQNIIKPSYSKPFPLFNNFLFFLSH